MPEPEKVVVKIVQCPECGKETEFGSTVRRCKHCDFPLSTHFDLDRVLSVRAKAREKKKGNGTPKDDDKSFHPLSGDIFD